MGASKELPVLAFESAAGWEAWLAEHHRTAAGVWLRFARKRSRIPSIRHAEALELALCYGWIDGQGRPFDDAHWLVRFTPRRPRSRWSQINRDKAEALIAAGRMQPAGLEEVERARADGRWDAAYEPQSRSTVPADLQAALDAEPAARAFFETLGRQNRYAILYRVKDAKRPQTRARRIATYVQMLAEGRTIYP